jgi:penicillin-binding protein 1A
VRTIIVAAVAMAAILGSTVVVSASILARQSPKLDLGADHLAPLEQAEARQVSRPTTVVAADGQTLGQFLPEQRFEPIGADEIPQLVADVVTASEDPDFYQHHGFTLRGVARAALANASAGDTVEGGSTITQQLAKNLYTDGERTLARKAREVAIATTLEDTYSKQQILAAYLNSTYFGEGAVGIRAASAVYFAKPLDQLNLSEVALLVGLIPAPSDRDPRSHPDIAEAARLHVLERAEATKRVDHATVAAALAQPPVLATPPSAASSQPFFTEYVRQWLLDVAHLPPDVVLGGGLRVETSLDPRVQEAATAAVDANLPDPNGPTGAVVVLDHGTGQVRALVGGRDWNTSKVDLARGYDGGGTGRQPGSSFKPFALATALVAGLRPDSPIPAPASLQVQGADHAIENYSGSGYGTVSLTDATVHSINTAYSWVTEQVGPQQVRDMAAALGIAHLPASGIGPSIGLGAYETSPLEMATAYSTIAEDGRRVTPVPVVRVTAPDGSVLIDNRAPAPGAPVLDPAVCRTVTSILTQVVDRGTGTAAKLDRPTAGKTGTTDDYSNAWFVGYTNQLTAAVWVGYPTANTPMHDINGVADVVGGTLPARIWHDVMSAASVDLPVESFADLLPLPPGTNPGLSVPPAPPPPAPPGPGQGKPPKHGKGH